MAALVAAHGVVAGIGQGAASIADQGIEHPGDGAEGGLDAPEAARAEGRQLAHGFASAVPPWATKVSATALMQKRRPVGTGPSSKLWPRCPPQRAQWTSVRSMP